MADLEAALLDSIDCQCSCLEYKSIDNSNVLGAVLPVKAKYEPGRLKANHCFHYLVPHNIVARIATCLQS